MPVAAVDTSGILGTPYKLGGRKPGVAIDCYGVTLELARRMYGAACAPDHWREIAIAWAHGRLEVATGFPGCWLRSAECDAVRHGDVLLFFARHPWCGIVVHGHLWTADADIGSAYCRPVDRMVKRPAEVWRHREAAHQEGPAG